MSAADSVKQTILGSPAERRDIVGWLLRAVVGGFFILVSLSKFNADPHGMWVQIFGRIGLGQWFRVATGIIQLVGGVLFLFPGTCRIGGAALAATMLGASVAHLTVLHDPLSIIVTGALLAVVVVVTVRDPTIDSTIATLERRKAKMRGAGRGTRGAGRGARDEGAGTRDAG